RGRPARRGGRRRARDAGLLQQPPDGEGLGQGGRAPRADRPDDAGSVAGHGGHTMRRNPGAAALVAATAAVALTLAGCGSSAGGGTGEVVSGGTFTVALNDDPGSLSPLTGVSLVQRGLVRYGYE